MLADRFETHRVARNQKRRLLTVNVPHAFSGGADELPPARRRLRIHRALLTSQRNRALRNTRTRRITARNLNHRRTLKIARLQIHEPRRETSEISEPINTGMRIDQRIHAQTGQLGGVGKVLAVIHHRDRHQPRGVLRQRLRLPALQTHPSQHQRDRVNERQQNGLRRHHGINHAVHRIALNLTVPRHPRSRVIKLEQQTRETHPHHPRASNSA